MLSQMSMKANAPVQLTKKLVVEMDSDILLKQWLSTARNLKDELEYIMLKFSSKPAEANINQNRLAVDEYEKRLVQVVANNCVGGKLQAASIVIKRLISPEMLRWMAPLLQPIISLIVDSPVNAHLLYGLAKFCPRVRMLRFLGTWFGNEDEPILNWPSLKVLVLTHPYLDVKSYTDNGKKFRRFLELNPQLDSLFFETTIDIELLKGIIDNLVNINMLSFCRLNYYRFGLILEHLTKVELLEAINIKFIVAEKDDLEMMVIGIERFGQMKSIKLIVLVQNYMPNTAQKEAFTMMNSFPITDHRKCACHYKQRLLDFDGVLPNLEVPDEVPVLAIIINTNNPIKSQDKSLESDILNALNQTKESFPNVIRFEVLKEENHNIYVHIATA